MSRASRIPNLGGASAFVLHRPHPTVQAISRQLSAIGLEVTGCWPELPAEALAADFVFFDADLGFDEQFPWKPGAAPMPLVALIGSEAPGRVEWALSHNADAQLLKHQHVSLGCLRCLGSWVQCTELSMLKTKVKPLLV